jgi:ssDNA-binding Zn-finger/Zn-ribbon topoisomerase 1
VDAPEHKQSVRNAWINRLRDEALRMRRVEVSKCVHIGILIGTYADADGTNAFPSGKTLAVIAGCTEETVTRCVKVLMAVGLLRRKRRPNQSSMYLLVLPLGKPVAWEEHLHLYTDTRQARRKKAIKEQEIAEALANREAGPDELRNPFRDGVRNPFPDGVPEPVPAGGSEESGTRSGTGGSTVPQRVPEPVPAGGDHYIPTFGRDPEPDQTLVEHPPQPQERAGEAVEDFDQSAEEDDQPFGRCEVCGHPLVRAGSKRCSAHRDTPSRRRLREGRSKPVQAPLLMSVPSAPDVPNEDVPATFRPSRPDPLAPLRTCGCGRDFRDHDPAARCPDCLYAEDAEVARLHRVGT